MSKILEKIPFKHSFQLPFYGKILLTIYWFFFNLLFFHNEKDYEKAISKLKTPCSVQAWLYRNVEYKKDEHDHWQPAEKTFKKQTGDCEDMAIFANECLKDATIGYILCMYAQDRGHATYICSGADPGIWHSIGSYGIMTHYGADTGSSGFSDYIPAWKGYKNWSYYKLYDKNLDLIEKVKKGE